MDQNRKLVTVRNPPTLCPSQNAVATTSQLLVSKLLLTSNPAPRSAKHGQRRSTPLNYRDFLQTYY
jgi:hypothetical protein